MKTYRMNALMAGVLYFLGSVFGVLSAVVGGELISSIVQGKPLSGSALLSFVIADSSRLIGGSFFILMMGISLAAMTAFLYPVFKKDSKELALGMLIFRGTLEGAWYFMTTLGYLALFALGSEYLATGANSAELRSMIKVLYQFQDLLAPTGTILFLVGATCLYISFYRTRLIPRWLSVWGLVGVIPYMAFALLHLFRMDRGVGLYLQMLLMPQEMVMAFWLIIKGFDRVALDRTMSDKRTE